MQLPAKATRTLLMGLMVLCLCAQTLAQDKPKQIDQLMSAYHNLGLFNGTVLVAENGKVIFKKGYGKANFEWNIPNTPDTKFRLGSITKQFTAGLIMQLIEQGKVKLDGKISDYLPEYRKDTGDRVTIHHLLTHTSGIPSYTSLPGFIQNLSREPYTPDAFVKKYTSGDLQFEPGTKFTYNNSGYFLLGAIIEKITGKPYEQVLKERIFDPLGMKDSGYDLHGPILARRASGYEKRPTGMINAPYLDMSIPYAAGSLYSTVEDLYLWDQALYTEKVMNAKSRELMFKPVMNGYAYGVVSRKMELGNTKETAATIEHGGGINGFNTVIIRFVDDRHLIVLLNNTGGARLNEISRGLSGIVYGKTYDPPKEPIADVLRRTINEKGSQAAVKQYHDLKSTQPAKYNFAEGELNSLGYQLLSQGKAKDAIEVFKLNVEAYPKSANTYDSLAEAYMKNSEKEFAIKYYRMSLEMNPNNPNAVEMLKKLEEKQ
jgi:CubicO group peptidase (beta-lactamase class C family)